MRACAFGKGTCEVLYLHTLQLEALLVFDGL